MKANIIVNESAGLTEFSLHLPTSFLHLCKLMEVSPKTLLRDFIDNLDCGSANRQGRDEAKAYLINYFIAHGYGQQQYAPEEIRQLFKEMDALGLLFPNDGDDEMIDQYVQWREKQQAYFFKKWWGRVRRRNL